MDKWGYCEENGPETWFQFYVNASGQRQSPVDIVTTKIVGSVQNPLTIKYSTDNCRDIVNSGYGWKVHCSGDNTELTGGPLEGKYILEQFHCHWGQTDDKGSEHTVDGKSYSGELHLVHWNATKYSSFAEAAEHRDGLAVVAVFLQEGDSHEEIKKLTNLLPKIRYNGEKFDLSDVKIDIEKCLPDDLSYWTYPGSLTTPPCSETVDWLILKAPIHISRSQLNLFRTLRYHKRGEEPPKDEMNGKLMKNYRPVFPIGDRMVRDFGCR